MCEDDREGDGVVSDEERSLVTFGVVCTVESCGNLHYSDPLYQVL